MGVTDGKGFEVASVTRHYFRRDLRGSCGSIALGCEFGSRCTMQPYDNDTERRDGCVIHRDWDL